MSKTIVTCDSTIAISPEKAKEYVKGQKVKIELPIECKKDWIIRRKK